MNVSIDGKANVSVNSIPDECPICHHNIEPRHLFATETANGAFDFAFKCPRQQCYRVFIGRYLIDARNGSFHLQETTPSTVVVPEMPQDLKALSPDFVETHADALRAEMRGYKRVTGPGYRKSLEFLVKDYCILKHPREAETIRSAPLGKVIEDFIDDAKIKACAKRATWLGNDETHYVRKWEDKDINDMKNLITLTSRWIETNLLTDKYMKEMN